MKLADLKNAMPGYIRSGVPTWLWGPPGVGKSSVIRQIADALFAEAWNHQLNAYGLAIGTDGAALAHNARPWFTDRRLALMNPVDLSGLPHIEDHRAWWTIPGWLPDKGPGILLIDEFGQAPPSMQKACLQLFSEGCINDYTLPPDVYVIAASNRLEDRAGIEKLLTPTLNRFRHIDVDLCVDGFCEHAHRQQFEASVPAFIRWRGAKMLLDFDPKTQQRAFASPKSAVDAEPNCALSQW